MDASTFKDATVRTAKTMARKGDEIEVFFAGSGAGASPNAIYLPALADSANILEEEAAVMRGYADHETLHHRLSCLHDKEVINRITSQTHRQHRLSNALEDMRIEQIGIALYPGMRTTLRATVEATAKRALDDITDEAYWEDIRRMAAVGITWLGRIKMGTAGDYTREAYGRLSDEIKLFCERALALLASEVESCVKAGRIVKTQTKRSAMQVMDLGAKLAKEIGEMAQAQPEPKQEPQQGQEQEPQQEQEQEPQQESNEDDGQRAGAEAEPESEPEAEAEPESEPEAEAEPDSESEGGEGQSEENAEEDGANGNGGEPDDDLESEPDDQPDSQSSGGGQPVENPSQSGINQEEENDEEMIDAEVDQAVEEMAKGINQRGAKSGGSKLIRITDEFDTAHSMENPGGGMIAEIFARNQALDEVYMRTISNGISNEMLTVKRKIERAIMAEDRRDYLVGQRSGKLNSSRLADAVSGKGGVFRRAEEGVDMDTAVCLVIDLSGSMRDSRIKLAVRAASILIDSLDRIGAKSCITGFCSSGRTSAAGRFFGRRFDKDRLSGLLQTVSKEYGSGMAASWVPYHHVVIKGWRERSSDAKVTMARLANKDVFQGYTPLPFGVRQAAIELNKRSERRKVMIVLTDGLPETGDISDSFVRDDAINAVAQARKAGIDVVSVGIELDTDHIFGKDSSHTIITASELSGTCLDIIAKSLMSGKSRRAA